MAAVAGPHHRRVIDAHRRPAHGGVAVVTGVAAQDVARRLAGGLDAVVAGNARARRHAAVIVLNPGPRRGGMTLVAVVDALHVPRRFSRRGAPVVTPCAGPDHGDVIHPPDQAPRGGNVAVVAVVGGRYVIDGLERSGDATAADMAFVTLRRRVSEHAAHVAALAVDTGVGTGQWKSGTEMIETLVYGQRRVSAHRHAYPQYQAQGDALQCAPVQVDAIQEPLRGVVG